MSTEPKSPYDILRDIQAHGSLGKEYVEKQLHKVPVAAVVDRVAFLVERCTGKTVLDIGCASGTLHGKLQTVAKRIYGIDLNVDGLDTDKVHSHVAMDLDKVCMDDSLPFIGPTFGIDTVVCGEVLEHLSNPGWLLHRIAISYPSAELIITAPNGFSSAGRSWIGKGSENVNKSHVAWYSWKTLTVLVQKYGYSVTEFKWYNGQPLTAEGLVFCCKLDSDTITTEKL